MKRHEQEKHFEASTLCTSKETTTRGLHTFFFSVFVTHILSAASAAQLAQPPPGPALLFPRGGDMVRQTPKVWSVQLPYTTTLHDYPGHHTLSLFIKHRLQCQLVPLRDLLREGDVKPNHKVPPPPLRGPRARHALPLHRLHRLRVNHFGARDRQRPAVPLQGE